MYVFRFILIPCDPFLGIAGFDWVGVVIDQGLKLETTNVNFRLPDWVAVSDVAARRVGCDGEWCVAGCAG